MKNRASGYAVLAALCLIAGIASWIFSLRPKPYPLWLGLGLPAILAVAAFAARERVVFGCAAILATAVLNAHRFGTSLVVPVGLLACALVLAGAGRNPADARWRRIGILVAFTIAIALTILLLPYVIF